MSKLKDWGTKGLDNLKNRTKEKIKDEGKAAKTTFNNTTAGKITGAGLNAAKNTKNHLQNSAKAFNENGLKGLAKYNAKSALNVSKNVGIKGLNALKNTKQVQRLITISTKFWTFLVSTFPWNIFISLAAIALISIGVMFAGYKSSIGPTPHYYCNLDEENNPSLNSRIFAQYCKEVETEDVSSGTIWIEGELKYSTNSAQWGVIKLEFNGIDTAYAGEPKNVAVALGLVRLPGTSNAYVYCEAHKTPDDHKSGNAAEYGKEYNRNTPIPILQWHKLRVEYDKTTGMVTAYIDGQKLGEQQGCKNFQPGSFHISARGENNGQSAPMEFRNVTFSCDLDEKFGTTGQWNFHSLGSSPGYHEISGGQVDSSNTGKKTNGEATQNVSGKLEGKNNANHDAKASTGEQYILGINTESGRKLKTSNNTSNLMGNSRIVEAAAKYVGYEYSQSDRWGAHSRDCSSLVVSALRDSGYACSDMTTSSMADGQLSGIGAQNLGSSLSLNDLKSGDIIVYRSSDSGHVVIYAGNNQIIHAKGVKWGVIQETISTIHDGSGKALHSIWRFL